MAPIAVSRKIAADQKIGTNLENENGKQGSICSIFLTIELRGRVRSS